MNTLKVKYPRTHHLPWSMGATSDDKTLKNINHFVGKNVIITEKLDGENTTMYNHSIHARSLTMDSHPSRDWVKQLWSSIRYNIPDGYRICGENMFAVHSIEYSELQSYFFAFSVWEHDTCLSWDDSLELIALLGLATPKVLYNGVFDEQAIRNIELDKDWDSFEGYVVRLADSFKYSDFSKSVAKYVRANHVTTDTHWKTKSIVRNKLIGNV